MEIDKPEMSELKANEDGGQAVNGPISTSSSSGFITVNLGEPEEEKLTSDTQSCAPSRESQRKESKRSRRATGSSKDALDEEALIEKSYQPSISPHLPSENEAGANLMHSATLESANQSSQELPNPCDLSPTTQLQDIRSSNPLDNLEVVASPHTVRSTQTPLSLKSTNVSATIFAFIMTVAFVCILWLVVFMVFGYRGHAIAGVFVALFLVGLLLNTCFLKLYFRLKVFLGLSAAIAHAERQQAAMQRHRQMQEQLMVQKASERPPSYDNAVASPPPYSVLQFYRQKKSTTSLTSLASRASLYKKSHNCPFCKKEVKMFGICLSCKKDLSQK